jgi:translation initiation factor 3 subunit K
MLNMNITQLILLKAITNLPFSDFVLCKYLLLPVQMRDDTVKDIIYIADILEQCDFVLFWQHIQNKLDVFEKITGFYVSALFNML